MRSDDLLGRQPGVQTEQTLFETRNLIKRANRRQVDGYVEKIPRDTLRASSHSPSRPNPGNDPSRARAKGSHALDSDMAFAVAFAVASRAAVPAVDRSIARSSSSPREISSSASIAIRGVARLPTRVVRRASGRARSLACRGARRRPAALIFRFSLVEHHTAPRERRRDARTRPTIRRALDRSMSTSSSTPD
jgi:hypothetical protein